MTDATIQNTKPGVFSKIPGAVWSTYRSQLGWQLESGFLEKYHRYENSIILASHSWGPTNAGMLLLRSFMHDFDMRLCVVTGHAAVVTYFGADNCQQVTAEGGTVKALVKRFKTQRDWAIDRKVLMFCFRYNREDAVEKLGSGAWVLARQLHVPILVFKMDFKARLFRLSVLETAGNLPKGHMAGPERLAQYLSTPGNVYTARDSEGLSSTPMRLVTFDIERNVHIHDDISRRGNLFFVHVALSVLAPLLVTTGGVLLLVSVIMASTSTP